MSRLRCLLVGRCCLIYLGYTDAHAVRAFSAAPIVDTPSASAAICARPLALHGRLAPPPDRHGGLAMLVDAPFIDERMTLRRIVGLLMGRRQCRPGSSGSPNRRTSTMLPAAARQQRPRSRASARVGAAVGVGDNRVGFAGWFVMQSRRDADECRRRRVGVNHGVGDTTILTASGKGPGGADFMLGR
jgi:hypothetical protein